MKKLIHKTQKDNTNFIRGANQNVLKYNHRLRLREHHSGRTGKRSGIFPSEKHLNTMIRPVTRSIIFLNSNTRVVTNIYKDFLIQRWRTLYIS